MLVVGFDTATPAVSVALHDGERIVGEAFAVDARRHGELLAPMIAKVVKAFGANRCMWESDCPFQVDLPHTYQFSIDLVRKHLDFVTDDDREWLLRKTAEGFFFSK